MDPKPAASLKPTLLLALLCAAVAALGVTWSAWDMFGPNRKSMLQGWDDSFYYFWLPSVVIDHDLDFSNQIAQTDTLDDSARQEALHTPRTATGLIPSKYPPGWALGSLPFFLAVRAVMPAASTGFEPPYLIAIWCGQLLYAGVGLWLALKIVGRFFSAGITRIAVLTGWLASSLVYYQSARLAMSHSQVFVLVAAVNWLALRILDGDTRRRNWMLLGLSAALLIVTRNVAFVYLTLPAVAVAMRLRRLEPAAWLAGGAVGPVVVQLFAWKILFGSWLAYSYGGERLDFAHLHLAEILFSPRHGWFYWQPLMLVGIVAFAAWAWRRREGRAWLVSLVAIALLNAAWPTWWLGSSFGHRGFEAATLFAMLGLAALFESLKPAWPRRLLLAGVATAVIWNIALLIVFLDRRIDRDGPVTYRDAASAMVNLARGGR